MLMSELIELFRLESWNNIIGYKYRGHDITDDKGHLYDYYYDFIIYYYTNDWCFEHKKPNKIAIVLDNELKIMGVEFNSEGDRVSRTPAWKRLCKAIADDEVFVPDIDEKQEDYFNE